MANEENKVVFGLKNVHYAPVESVDEDGNITYGDVRRIPGAVNLTLDPKGDYSPFYADDGVYYGEHTNQGYTGTLEIAKVPEHFEIDILGAVKDETTGMISEYSNAKQKNFAMMWEFDGDKKAVRHVAYYNSVSRPSIGGETKTETTTPRTSTLNLEAMQRPSDSLVKAKTSVSTPEEFYDSFFDKVPIMGEAVEG